jgi:GAF domain-containing protein
LKTRMLHPRQVLVNVDQALAQKLSPRSVGKRKPLEDVAEALHGGRRYSSVAIYLVAGTKAIRQSFCGPVPPANTFEFGIANVGSDAQIGTTGSPETKSQIFVPIKIASRTLGLINVESDREHAFSGKERVLLKEVAARLARYLTSRGKVIVRHVREQERAAANVPKAEERGYQPASEKAAGLRAAAGEGRRT